MTITVYSKPACVYCEKAKALLTRLGYEYTEKVVTKDISLPELFEELGKQVRTIPQNLLNILWNKVKLTLKERKYNGYSGTNL